MFKSDRDQPVTKFEAWLANHVTMAVPINICPRNLKAFQTFATNLILSG